MRSKTCIVISLVVVLMTCFVIPAKAQELDLTGIELPEIPKIEKPISQMTIPEIKAKIQEILVVVQQLQTLLAKLQSGISGIPGGYAFKANLKYGTSSQDVKYLQIVLNQDPETQVSDTGWGSPGQESMYFGQKTLQAVIKFQEKYEQDILSPYNLAAGTGYVGATTRDKLNEILEQGPSVITPIPTPTPTPTPTDGGGGGGAGEPTPAPTPIPALPPTNNPPVLNLIGNKTVTVNNTLAFTISATDPDNNPLTYSAQNLPSGASFNSSTRTFTWTPSNTGTYTTITFTVSDSSLTDSETITITVSLVAQSYTLTVNTTNGTVTKNPNQNSYTSGTQVTLTATANTGYTFTSWSGDLTGTTNPATITMNSNKTITANFSRMTLLVDLTVSTNSSNWQKSLTGTAPLSGVDLRAVVSGTATGTINYSFDCNNDGVWDSPDTSSYKGITQTTKEFTNGCSYSTPGTYTAKVKVERNIVTPGQDTVTITVSSACVPTTCQAQAKNCGTISDNCGGTLNCGTCSAGYTCTSGVCVQSTPPPIPPTSCTTDSDCTPRGPGFICNTSKVCEWKPPIGIPKPTFGIEETYRMYDTPANRNPALTYTQNTEGGYYTHYLDNTHPAATDASNPYGTESKPRKSIPWNLPPGSVVEIYSEPSNYGPSAEVLISGEGTKERPIFIRGVGNPRIERQVDIGYYGNASYIIVEGINSFSGGVHARIEGISFTVSHIAFRNCDFHGDENGGAFGISSWTSNNVEHIVLYNSAIHDNGIWDRGDDVDRDIGGIKVGAKVSYLWVVDNEMYHNECNGIQLSGGSTTHHIYVGRNVAHHNRQSGFWTKSAEDVIFSENTAYGHIPAPFSDPFGAGLGFQYDPDRVWFLFNRIYNNTSGIRCGSSRLGGGRKEIHYIGNIIYDIQGMALGIYDHGDDGDAYFVGNTMYNVGTGITDGSGADDTATIVNNIFGTLNDPSTGYHIKLESSAYLNNAVVNNNLFQEPMKVNTGCNNCIQANPLFADAANGNFRLQPTSPAIDAGIESQVYQRFYDLYGIDIKKDIEGRTRPQDGNNNGTAEWDMGAYEYPSGTGTCSGIDTSCGTWPSCQNCNNLDVCSGNSYRNYYCSGTSCIYTEDNCSDCSCSCGGYNVTESIANNNCSDGKDNDCDGQTDSQDTGCQECTSGQTSSCTTGLQGICSSGTKTCQANGTWGSCVQNNSPTAEICTDSLDNDCDGTTDCADTDCSADPICATAIPSDYISYWKFEGNALDEKGINNGTLFGNTTFINDPNKGNVVSFDGDGDYIDFGDINLMDNLSAITISAWVKYNRVAGLGVIASKWNSQSANRCNWKINYGIDTNIDYYYYLVSLYDSVGGAHTVSTGWKTGSNTNWHHVVGVYNGSYVLLYVDSIQVGTPSAMTGNTGSSDVKVSIGSQYAGLPPTPANFVNGSIDDVMIFNRGLSQKEIVSLYAMGAQEKKAVGYWKMDTGYGTTAYDSSGLGNNLTFSGSTESWTDSGKFGRAWDGNGAKWLSIADDPDFDFTASEDFSISMWFKSDSASPPGTNEFLIEKKASSAGYAIYTDTNGDVIFGIDDDTTWTPNDKAGDVGRNFYDNTWHNVVAVKTGTTRIDIYVDGVLIDSDVSIISTLTLENNALLYIGDSDGADNGDEFTGDIDEVKIYRFALTADDVKLEYNRGKAVQMGGQRSQAETYCPPGFTGTCTPPVGYWKMDEAADNTCALGVNDVCDSSSNVNDGALVDNTSWKTAADCQSGSCLSFDGAGDYVNVIDANSLDITNAITISAWIYPFTGGGGNMGRIVSKEVTTAAAPYALQMRTLTEQTQLEITTNQGTKTGISPTISLNRWTHIVGTWNGSQIITYANGVAGTATNLSGTMSATANNVLIGNNPTNTRAFNGIIDEVMIFNRALSQEEIAWLYNKGKPVGHWKMNEGEGTTAKDSSVNNLSGTISGASWTSSGKYNSGLDFDGTDDVVTVTKNSIIDLKSKTSYAISAWVYPHTSGESDANGGQFISKGTNTYMRVDTSSGGRVNVSASLGLATPATLTISSAIPLNTWSHILMAYTDDSDDEITIYINGVNMGSSANGDGSPADDSASDLLIGGPTTANFDGLIDEVKIYNYELTPEQVKMDYNQGAAIRFGD